MFYYIYYIFHNLIAEFRSSQPSVQEEIATARDKAIASQKIIAYIDADIKTGATRK